MIKTYKNGLIWTIFEPFYSFLDPIWTIFIVFFVSFIKSYHLDTNYL